MISVLCALVVTVTAFFAYRLVAILPLFEPYNVVAQLGCALGLVVIAVALHRRRGDWPALLLLIGSGGLAGACLHDSFIHLGLRYDWFQFGGTDGLVFRGFFEPRENPLLAIPAEVSRYIALLTNVGIFWLTMRLMQRRRRDGRTAST